MTVVVAPRCHLPMGYNVTKPAEICMEEGSEKVQDGPEEAYDSPETQVWPGTVLRLLFCDFLGVIRRVEHAT